MHESAIDLLMSCVQEREQGHMSQKGKYIESQKVVLQQIICRNIGLVTFLSIKWKNDVSSVYEE